MSTLSKEIQIQKIQSKWKKIVSFKNSINKEFHLLRDILETVLRRIDKNSNIIVSKIFKKVVKKINYISEIFMVYPSTFTYQFIFSISKFKLYSDMAKIKLGLIEITQMTGLIDIFQSLVLFLDSTSLPDKYQEYLEYYNKFFNITRIESYTSKNNNNISFALNTYGKEIKKTNISLTSYQLNKPTVNKYNTVIKNINIQVLGAKIFIPYKNRLLILFGYFKNDNLNTYTTLEIFKDKYRDLSNLISNLDINEEFKMNYLETLAINDFNMLSASQICHNCMTQYNEIIKYKSWNISKIVKNFVLSNDLHRYNIIKNLAIDTTDPNSVYIANLLIDLINNSDNILKFNNILGVFHWKIRNILKKSKFILDKQVNTDISTEIPYDKKIHLLKTTEEVKNKATDKLKEINSGKPGESNNKATQYLDGLLKIPFGVYKKSTIKKQLDVLLLNISKHKNLLSVSLGYLEENNILNDIDLSITEKLQLILKNNSIIKKPINIYRFLLELKTWKDGIKNNLVLKEYYKSNDLRKYLSKKYKLSELKELLINFNLTKSGSKKTDLINTMISDKVGMDAVIWFNETIKLKKNFNILFLTREAIDIFKLIDLVEKDYENYKNLQNLYFKDIDNVLNESIYGLDLPKIQIKRILAQWINGKNDGYIFGFEGPPGTGKTTLAKKGIAKCLKDEFGVERPFIFIPLGGSSNGSTLEGHNYTYVGSTWGRIVDGLMTSKCMNPIIYIDELDKISKTEHGKELIGILTHMTDKSQNSEFMDKYFSGIKLDISKCLIIFSYNDPNLIDRILLDRIHRISIKPLNKKSKLIVAKKHLIPDILDNIGYTDQEIIINDKEIEYIIDKYTYEAGARKLKEKLYEIYRDINLKSLENYSIIPFTINKDYIEKTFIEYNKNELLQIYENPIIGTIHGLFATSAGVGGITIIEAKKFTSKNHLELKLTGMQGDVMKESMEVSKTLALSIIPENIRKKIIASKDTFGIHVHCPAGATKKDGPSAGTAITIAIISLLCNIPIKNEIGITGEINLNGNMLPIGGLYSKLEGAKIAGIKKVLCPFKNNQDLDKILKENENLTDDFFSVECKNDIYEALEETLIFKNKKAKQEFLKRQ
tara:strand:- start:3539 stop:6868 length:3330 start_codon:yes stop_codon:yes gene_type:complete